MKTIETYIKFAIDNWYEDFDWYIFDWIIEENNQIKFVFIVEWEIVIQETWKSYIELITSLSFLEAITRGVLKNEKLFNKKERETNWWLIVRIDFNHKNYPTIRYEKYPDWEDTFILHKLSSQDNLKIITHLQAIAIRDWKLNSFINNLLNLWKQ